MRFLLIVKLSLLLLLDVVITLAGAGEVLAFVMPSIRHGLEQSGTWDPYLVLVSGSATMVCMTFVWIREVSALRRYLKTGQ